MLVQLFMRGLDLKINIVSLDPEGKLLVLDANSSESGAFHLGKPILRQGLLVTPGSFPENVSYISISRYFGTQSRMNISTTLGYMMGDGRRKTIQNLFRRFNCLTGTN